MRRTRSKTQSKRKPIEQTTGEKSSFEFVFFRRKKKPFSIFPGASLSLCEKYGYKSTVWQPPPIIKKHLQILNDDSVLMDTDLNELDWEAVPVIVCKSNDITMKDIIEQVNSDENMEFSTGDGTPRSEKPNDETVNATEMTVDSGNSFELSQPLFDSDTDDFECVILSHIVDKEPTQMEPDKTVAIPVSPQLSIVNCAQFRESPNEQPLKNEIDNINSTEYWPIRKRTKRLNSNQLTPLMMQLTGNIIDHDFASKLCRMKTTDEMIDLFAEQTLRVDQLLEELFSMR